MGAASCWRRLAAIHPGGGGCGCRGGESESPPRAPPAMRTCCAVCRRLGGVVTVANSHPSRLAAPVIPRSSLTARTSAMSRNLARDPNAVSRTHYLV